MTMTDEAEQTLMIVSKMRSELSSLAMAQRLIEGDLADLQRQVDRIQQFAPNADERSLRVLQSVRALSYGETCRADLHAVDRLVRTYVDELRGV
jgi:hypothetical protein